MWTVIKKQGGDNFKPLTYITMKKFNSPSALTCARNSNAYKSAMSAIAELGRIVKTGENVGRGKWSGSKEWTQETVREIQAHGYVASTGNNAPKGGRNGEFVVAHYKTN